MSCYKVRELFRELFEDAMNTAGETSAKRRKRS